MSNTLSLINEMQAHQSAIDSLTLDIRALDSKYVQETHIQVHIETRDFNYKGVNGHYKIGQGTLKAILVAEKQQHEDAVKRIIGRLAKDTGANVASDTHIDLSDDTPF